MHSFEPPKIMDCKDFFLSQEEFEQKYAGQYVFMGEPSTHLENKVEKFGQTINHVRGEFEEGFNLTL